MSSIRLPVFPHELPRNSRIMALHMDLDETTNIRLYLLKSGKVSSEVLAWATRFLRHFIDIARRAVYLSLSPQRSPSAYPAVAIP